MGGQRRGRLVEDEDAGVDRERLGDLDQLLVGHRQAPDERVGVDPDVEQLEQAFRGAPHLAPRRRSRSRRVGGSAEEDVLGHREVREQARLLVDDRDPERARGRGAGDRHGFAASSIVPASGAWTPARILTSVLLPAPFSPTSAWTSPGAQLERDVVQGLRRVEALRDAAQGDGRRRACRRPRRPDRRRRGRRRSSSRCVRPRRADRPARGRRMPRDRRRHLVHGDPRRRRSSTMAGGAASSVTTAVELRRRAERGERGAAPLRVVDEGDDLAARRATMRRLICASSSVASLRPVSMVKPAAPMNAFWMFTFSNSPSPSGPTTLSASQRTKPAGHRDGDARVPGQLRRDPQPVGDHGEVAPAAARLEVTGHRERGRAGVEGDALAVDDHRRPPRGRSRPSRAAACRSRTSNARSALVALRRERAAVRPHERGPAARARRGPCGSSPPRRRTWRRGRRRGRGRAPRRCARCAAGAPRRRPSLRPARSHPARGASSDTATGSGRPAPRTRTVDERAIEMSTRRLKPNETCGTLPRARRPRGCWSRRRHDGTSRRGTAHPGRWRGHA